MAEADAGQRARRARGASAGAGATRGQAAGGGPAGGKPPARRGPARSSPPGDAELLARLLDRDERAGGAGALEAATAMLAESAGLGSLAREGVSVELARAAGIDDRCRERLEAALELGRRAMEAAALRELTQVAGPREVAAWGRARLGALSHEEIWLLSLDARHGLLSARRVAQGGGSSCGTTAKDILRMALRAGASAFVLVHNHPSGDPTPSPEDARMTREVARAASAVGLPLLDHVVVGGPRHASLYELGLLELSEGPPLALP